MGHFLTTTGNPPSCGQCNPGPDEGSFSCVTNGCGPGMDCCLPSDVKEKGAGFMIADSPNPYKILRPEVAYMQFDGAFAPEGGSEPAYNLSTYLGTEYINNQDVTFITSAEGPGVQDVWMTGYLDGECDIDDDGGVDFRARETDCGGKVSYLGGHQYTGKAGTRLFLNALFEADCVTNPNWPEGGGGGDADGDGIPDDQDPFPNDPNRCGDSDGDGCDDCTSGAFDPADDGVDVDGDGLCENGNAGGDAGTGGGGDSGGCGCQASGPGLSVQLLFLLALGALLRGRRRRGSGR
jgi:MYXO-CTERM domain-containing protein